MRSSMLLAALVCATACTREPTEIFLVVRSNLHLAEIDAIRVRVMYLEDGEQRLLDPAPSPYAIPPLDHADGDRVRVEQYMYTHRWTHEFVVHEGTVPLEI